MCCSGKSEACWMGSHFVVACCPRFVCHIVLAVTRGGRGEGVRIFCSDSTFLKSDKWQDLGNLVASCHISQTSQTRNGYKWFILPGCLPDGWTDGRTKATEPWLPHLYHYHPTSHCVCGWVGGSAAHSAHPSGSLGEWQSDICIGKKGENVTRLDLNCFLSDSDPAHISRFVFSQS